MTRSRPGSPLLRRAAVHAKETVPAFRCETTLHGRQVLPGDARIERRHVPALERTPGRRARSASLHGGVRSRAAARTPPGWRRRPCMYQISGTACTHSGWRRVPPLRPCGGDRGTDAYDHQPRAAWRQGSGRRRQGVAAAGRIIPGQPALAGVIVDPTAPTGHEESGRHGAGDDAGQSCRQLAEDDGDGHGACTWCSDAAAPGKPRGHGRLRDPVVIGRVHRDHPLQGWCVVIGDVLMFCERDRARRVAALSQAVGRWSPNRLHHPRPGAPRLAAGLATPDGAQGRPRGPARR